MIHSFHKDRLTLNIKKLWYNLHLDSVEVF